MLSSASLPERFIFPALGAPHCRWVNHGILGKQRLDVRRERVRGIDGVQPVSDATETWIEPVGGEMLIGYPFAVCIKIMPSSFRFAIWGFV